MAALERTAEDTRSFVAEAGAVLARVRAAFAALVESLPGNNSNASELQRTLGTRANLSWRTFKIASAPTPLEIALYVPGRGNLQALAAAAARCEVPDQVIQATLKAGRDFEDVVALHAGDRATFDSMISSLAGDESAEQMDLVHRRLAFRGMRHTLGLQAKTTLKSVFLCPSPEDPALVDVAAIEGFITLRRLRGDVGLYFASFGVTNDDGSSRRFQREPIGPVLAPGGMGVLEEFCSAPVPEFRTVETVPGEVDCELITTGVGKRAAVTCLAAHVARSVVPRYRDDLNRVANFYVKARLPSECLIFDLMVHDDTYDGQLAPRVHAYSEHIRPLPRSGPSLNSHCIPLHVPVTYIGKGASVLHCPDVPRYAEMGHYVFDHLAWEGDRFEVYRCRIEYPAVPSVIQIQCDLPEALGA